MLIHLRSVNVWKMIVTQEILSNAAEISILMQQEVKPLKKLDPSLLSCYWNRLVSLVSQFGSHFEVPRLEKRRLAGINLYLSVDSIFNRPVFLVC